MAHANGFHQAATIDDLPAELSARIRAARRHRGLTQQEVAHKVGITVRSISGWERGKAIPHLDTLEALARALGQDPDKFIVPAQWMAAARRARRVDRIAPRIHDGLSAVIQRLRALGAPPTAPPAGN
jgi:transcriptional regulator with XRE-family HTH domain